MTIINSLHILLCSRENCACRQRCLLLCQGGGEKSCRSSKGKRGESEWGVKIMGPTQSALFHTFCYVCSKRSHNYLGVCSSPRAPPLPLLRLHFFLPSSAVFLGEQRGLVTLAALHSSTTLGLQITRFCRRC